MLSELLAIWYQWGDCLHVHCMHDIGKEKYGGVAEKGSVGVDMMEGGACECCTCSQAVMPTNFTRLLSRPSVCNT